MEDPISLQVLAVEEEGIQYSTDTTLVPLSFESTSKWSNSVH
jgi:hypothetical protein